jgi:hypothetical protein
MFFLFSSFLFANHHLTVWEETLGDARRSTQIEALAIPQITYRTVYILLNPRVLCQPSLLYHIVHMCLTSASCIDRITQLPWHSFVYSLSRVFLCFSYGLFICSTFTVPVYRYHFYVKFQAAEPKQNNLYWDLFLRQIYVYGVWALLCEPSSQAHLKLESW